MVVSYQCFGKTNSDVATANTDISSLSVYCNLWQNIPGGGKPKYYITGNFSS